MKYTTFIFLLLLLNACGKSGVEKDAEAICDCLRKTKSSASVEDRSKCMDLHRASGEKYLKSPEDLKKFNEMVTPCIIETVGQ